MTATVPRPRPLTTGGLVSLHRPKVVYGAPIRDPHNGQVRIDYVGKTIRALRVREAEHRGLGRNPGDEQPWSDLVDGPFVVLEQDTAERRWSDEELAARERAWIRNEGGLLPARPRYNWADGGHDNPLQIPKWTAAEQRAARDRGRGVVSRWTNPELFPPRHVDPTVVPPRPAVSRVVPSSTLWRRFWASPVGRWASYRLRQAGAVAAWWAGLAVAATGVLWAGAAYLRLPLTLPHAAEAAAVVVTVGMARWWPRPRPTRPRRKPR